MIDKTTITVIWQKNGCTCELFHDDSSKLYLYGDYYIADEFLPEKSELQENAEK